MFALSQLQATAYRDSAWDRHSLTADSGSEFGIRVHAIQRRRACVPTCTHFRNVSRPLTACTLASAINHAPIPRCYPYRLEAPLLDSCSCRADERSGARCDTRSRRCVPGFLSRHRQSHLAAERGEAWIVLEAQDEGVEEKIIDPWIAVAHARSSHWKVALASPRSA